MIRLNTVGPSAMGSVDILTRRMITSGQNSLIESPESTHLQDNVGTRDIKIRPHEVFTTAISNTREANRFSPISKQNHERWPH